MGGGCGAQGGQGGTTAQESWKGAREDGPLLPTSITPTLFPPTRTLSHLPDSFSPRRAWAQGRSRPSSGGAGWGAGPGPVWTWRLGRDVARRAGLGPPRLAKSPGSLYVEVGQRKASLTLVSTLHVSPFPRLDRVLTAAPAHSSSLHLRQFPTPMFELLRRRQKAWASVWAQGRLQPLGASASCWVGIPALTLQAVWPWRLSYPPTPAPPP